MDSLSALAQYKAKLNQQPSGWQTALGLFGGALKDFSAVKSGHPELANGMSDYGNMARERRLEQLKQNAQSQVLDSLGNGSTLPADLPLKLAKMNIVGLDTSATSPIGTYMSARSSMMPTYSKDEDGNVWQQAPGQPPQLLSRGPGKIMARQLGQSLDATNPYGFGDAPAGAPAPSGAPATPTASAPPTSPASLPTGDQVAAAITQQYPGARVTSGLRTPGQNAAANGVSNSAHLQDTPTTWARDIVLPNGTDHQAAANQINALGIPGIKALYEGPGAANSTGPHLHVQYIAPSGSAQATSSPASTPQNSSTVRELSPATPLWRSITDPAEAQRLGVNVGSRIGLDGDVKPLSTSDIPIGVADPAIQAAGANYFTTGQMGTGGRDAGSMRAIRAAAVQYGLAQNPGMTADQVGVMMTKNAQDYKNATHAVQAFSTGPQGQKTTAANNAIGHLGVLAQYAQALGNGDVQTLNSMKQRFQQEFGTSAPTNFAALAQIAGPEVVKTIVNNGGGEGDRQGIAQTLSRAQSPQQLAGAIQTYQGALGRQLQDASIAYKAATGRTDFASRFLAPDVVPVFNAAKPTAPSSTKSPISGASQTATNPKTGQKIYLVNGRWVNSGGLPLK